ncbi:MAG TPA: hypothetical protein VF631_10565 [Allosphingosinicella sp.]|uniref:hypothetical protein n=1 Tax=Allosphingosinicella sp. TaxID=2823234 RepID=UPI002F29ECBB
MITLTVLAMLAAAQAAPEATVPADEKMICQKKAITGSRVRFEKVCMTERQWRDRRANNARMMQENDRGIAPPAPAGSSQ